MLTIAQASGLIAGGLMVVQYILPLALVIILVKFVGNENTAASWSSVNRIIANTIWPLFLQTDSIRPASRSRSVVALNWTLSIAAVLLVLAGVLTPLGLREEILRQPSMTKVKFQYAKDQTAWGAVTMPRPEYRFGRYCEFGVRINCPGQYDGIDMKKFGNGTYKSVKNYDSATINTVIPANYTAMFSSATDDVGNTISGLFDIQHRRWTASYDDITNHGEAQIQGVYRYIENLIPLDDVLVRDGLVIDVRDNPGIGFRNHTIPIDLSHGGRWSEDLTWLEPVTSCVDTNISIEIDIVDTVENFGVNKTTYIVDRGAFRDLDLSALESGPWIDNQTLDLFGRAHKAARMYNVFIADAMNLSLPLAAGNNTIPKRKVTASSVKQNHTMRVDATLFSDLTPELIQIQSLKGIEYRDVGQGNQNISVPKDFVPKYPNGMRKMFASNFSAIANICRGFYTLETTTDLRASNITNPGVRCGILLGAGHSTKEWNDVSMNPKETVTKNLYICASAMRASIKTVDFLYNGTNGQLSNLKVENISDKVYSDEKSKPLWAVETSGDRIMQFDPLWGIVNDSYETTEGFSTMRSEKLWLPAIVSDTMMFGSNDGWHSLAAIQIPVLVIVNIYQSFLTSNDQYTGNKLYSLVERFLKLSANATLASQIPSLIISDSLASMLVGTKTSIRTDKVTFPAQLGVNDPLQGVPRAEVWGYSRHIKYDLRYSIPAIILLILLAAVLVWSLTIITLTRGSVITNLRDMDNQISTGRLATSLLFPGRTDPNQASREWTRDDGNLLLKFGRIGDRKAEYFMGVLDPDAIPEYQAEPETPLSPIPKTPLSPMRRSKEEPSVRTALVRADSYEMN